MKYYSVNLQIEDEKSKRNMPKANGKNIKNASQYFARMDNGEFLNDIPVLDYFVFESYESPEFWEIRICDAHGYTGVYTTAANWYVSEKLQRLLVQFSIQTPYQFYKSKLLFKGNKFDYFVFQIRRDSSQYIDYINSTFWVRDYNTKQNIRDYEFKIKSSTEFYGASRRLLKEEKAELYPQSLRYFELFNFIYCSITRQYIIDNVIKDTLIEANITGLDYKPLDFFIES